MSDDHLCYCDRSREQPKREGWRVAVTTECGRRTVAVSATNHGEARAAASCLPGVWAVHYALPPGFLDRG